MRNIKKYTLKQLKRIASKIEIKPTWYHFVCHAEDDWYKTINEWHKKKKMKCNKKKDIIPYLKCKNCTGELKGNKKLRKDENYFNDGINAFIKELEIYEK